ncbi:uncharacterized protein LOC108679797 [Hyalella azteca]|uniref:Uncharacterized protein LOC108679797 n=1 Tax=Hyalella azteca TaxID=294128 RepID=A0A8B7PD44_HYAAZ|nr:uncharacterized protein LOC108679797 [Hyalella azteca]
MFRLPQNGSNGTNADGVEAVTAVNSIARALGRTLFASQAARRNQAASNNLILNGTFSESQEREPTVFERNFEASKTQASINRLEKEVGSFLGRLLGTIYRNADPIDESLSKGIRRVLGARVPNSTNDTGTTKISAVSAPSDSTKSAESSTGSPVAGTTRRPFQFRLSFDDIDPAPARNSDHSGP